jgi:hypothetical protein
LWLGLGVGAAFLAAPARVEATPYLFRSLTLPRGAGALDLGLGIGRMPDPRWTGVGLNLELAVGVSSDFELGIRTGVRFGQEGRATRADAYGRTWETEHYGVGSEEWANPEVRMTLTVARGTNVQLGLEGRAYLPVEDGTYFGIMIAMPLLLRIGSLRVDSGLYIPIIFAEPRNFTTISIPLHLWLQASHGLWLGPLLGLRVVDGGDNQYPLGFGLGLAISGSADLRTWILFPDISGEAAARAFGFGFGLEVRF